MQTNGAQFVVALQSRTRVAQRIALLLDRSHHDRATILHDIARKLQLFAVLRDGSQPDVVVILATCGSVLHRQAVLRDGLASMSS